MGLGHRLGEFLWAASELGDRGPMWAFVGGGQRRSEVETFAAAHPSTRVQVLPYVPQEDVTASLAAADVHLVSLRSAWQGLIVPSKLQTAFTLGRPVIFVGPRENEVADWVLASGGGWVVDEDDVRGLLKAVASASDPAERARRGVLARAFARQYFDRETNTARIADLLESAAQRPN
jgi:glycosyltransferase involved in cell wall biosynthesis